MTLQLTEVAAGIHRLASRYENWYLLEQGGRLTVLDAGLPAQWDRFLTALDRLGHAPDAVDALPGIVPRTCTAPATPSATVSHRYV